MYLAPSIVLALALLAPVSSQAPAQSKPVGGHAESYYLFLQGRQLEADGQVDAAIKLYKQAAEADPRSGEILAELAALYARQNRPREAISTAESALQKEPDSTEAHWVLGTIYSAYAQSEQPSSNPVAASAAKEYALKAIPHLEAVQRARGAGTDPGLLMTLARLYIDTGDYDKAIPVIGRFNELEPDVPEGTAMLAQAYAAAGKIEEATKVLEQAAAKDPAFYPVLGELYERSGRWGDAADAYKRASTTGTANTEVKRRWAMALLNSGRTGDDATARDLLQQVVTQNPKDARAMYLLAQAQRRTRDYQAAETTARKLMTIDPDGASGPFALAQIYEQQHEYKKVVDTLQPLVDRLLSSPPAGRTIELTPLLTSLGFAYIDSDQPDRAISVLQRAKDRSPDDSTVDVGLIQAHITSKQYRLAVALAEKAREKHPDEVRFARLQADALRRDGDVEGAVSLLEQVVNQHPGDVDNYITLAELLMSSNRLEQASGVLQKAQARFPDNASLTFARGAAYEREKKFAEAEDCFRKVIARDEQNATALNYLGYMLADRGVRLTEALEYIQRALKLDPNNPAFLDSLGWTYFKLQRLDLAETNLQQAAAMAPHDSAVQDHWGDVLSRLGRRDQAIAAWRRALAGDGDSIDRAAIESKIRSAEAKVIK